MKRSLTMGLILVLLLACIGVASANLVLNPGFESPGTFSGTWKTLNAVDSASITPWSVDVNSIDHINNYWQNNAGSSYSVDLAGNAPGTISQTIAAKDGQTCTLSFYMSGNPDKPGTKSVNVFWGASEVTGSPFTFATANSLQEMKWEQKTASGLTATGPTTIKFVADPQSSAYGPALDDISVECRDQQTPVPEFPTMALPAALIVGMLGAVLFIQRTKEN